MTRPPPPCIWFMKNSSRPTTTMIGKIEKNRLDRTESWLTVVV